MKHAFSFFIAVLQQLGNAARFFSCVQSSPKTVAKSPQQHCALKNVEQNFVDACHFTAAACLLAVSLADWPNLKSP
jgi:hypothetical protein